MQPTSNTNAPKVVISSHRAAAAAPVATPPGPPAVATVWKPSVTPTRVPEYLRDIAATISPELLMRHYNFRAMKPGSWILLFPQKTQKRSIGDNLVLDAATLDVFFVGEDGRAYFFSIDMLTLSRSGVTNMSRFLKWAETNHGLTKDNYFDVNWAYRTWGFGPFDNLE